MASECIEEQNWLKPNELMTRKHYWSVDEIVDRITNLRTILHCERIFTKKYWFTYTSVQLRVWHWTDRLVKIGELKVLDYWTQRGLTLSLRVDSSYAKISDCYKVSWHHEWVNLTLYWWAHKPYGYLRKEFLMISPIWYSAAFGSFLCMIGLWMIFFCITWKIQNIGSHFSFRGTS